MSDCGVGSAGTPNCCSALNIRAVRVLRLIVVRMPDTRTYVQCLIDRRPIHVGSHSARSLYRSSPSMAVKIEQGEVFTARRQRFVSIESLMIHPHDALVASVELTEPVPALHRWGPHRPNHSSPFSVRSNSFDARMVRRRCKSRLSLPTILGPFRR